MDYFEGNPDSSIMGMIQIYIQWEWLRIQQMEVRYVSTIFWAIWIGGISPEI